VREVDALATAEFAERNRALNEERLVAMPQSGQRQARSR